MINEHKNGGPAFPCTIIEGCENGTKVYVRREEGGMTLRDFFAAAAMQGMAARDIAGTPLERAEAAFAVADAMLKERAK